jgi:PAS domain S-box-containing protein
MGMPIAETGRVVKVRGIFQDITERKQVEDILRISEERLKEAQHFAMMGSWEWNLLTNQVWWSDETYSIFGVTPQEFVPSFESNGKFIHPDDFAQYNKVFEHSLQTGEALDVDLRLIAGDEKLKYCHTMGKIVNDDSGQPVRFIGTIMDITQRKLTEEKLRENEERYRRFFENMHETFIIQELVVDEEGRAIDVRYLDLNPAAERVIGRLRSEIVGHTRSEIAGKPDPEGVEMVKQVTTSGEPFHMVRYSLGFDGWFESFTYSLGSGIAATLALDISERKRAENKLAETLVELERSNQELEQFAYVASHDLQEPLRMISSYTQLLSQRYQGQLDEKAQKYIAYAVDGAVRMQQLINDLLAYSRVNTRGQQPEPIDTNGLVGEVLRNLSVIIRESQAQVTKDELPTVRADPTQLRQLFQNLISNAIKFHSDAPVQVHISACDLGNAWRFAVKDNGIGIEAQYAERIFIIFQRLHTRQEYPGTGIGLAVCKRIVERHGGKIWFESEPGKGSTFYFTLLKQ